MRLNELQESPAESLWMDESDPVSARARPAFLVDQGHAARFELLQDVVDIGHAQGKVVQSVAAFFEKFFQAGIAARRNQFQRSAVREIEERRVEFLRYDLFFVLDFLPEDI